MNKKTPLPILTDSREQNPYEFEGAVTAALKSGDYSLFGFEDQIAIERKSLADAYSSLGSNRERFRREMERLSKMDYAAIVIESTMEEFLKAPPYSQMNPRAAINTLLSWSIRFKVNIFFAGNRRLGRTLTYRLLEKFWKHKKEAMC